MFFLMRTFWRGLPSLFIIFALVLSVMVRGDAAWADARDHIDEDVRDPSVISLMSTLDEAAPKRVQLAQTGEFSQPIVTFRNDSQYPIDVLYVDQNGLNQIYETMQPGAQVQAQAPVGFLFNFGYNNQSLLGQYQVTAQPQQFLALNDQTFAQAGVNPQAGRQQLQTQAPAQNEPPSMAIANSTGVQVDLLYIDQNGQYAVAGSIPAGQQVLANTRNGDVWYFGAQGQIIANYTATDAARQPVDLTPALVAQFGGPAQPNQQNQAANAGGAVGMRQLEPIQPPAAPEVVDFEGGPKVNAPTAAQATASLGQTDTRVPVRANWNAATWAVGPAETVMFLDPGANGFLQGSSAGTLELVDQKVATSASNWYLEQVPGTEHFYMRNTAMVDSYVYIEPSTNGLMFGPQGLDLPTGLWRFETHPASDSFRFIKNVGAQGMALVGDESGVRVEFISPDQPAPYPKTWVAQSTPDWKEFLATMLELVPALQEMGQNIAQLEADYARQQEEARLAAEAKIEAERQALLAIPYSATDPNDTGYFWLHPGQFPVSERNGTRGITYDFSQVQFPDLYKPLFQLPKVGDGEDTLEFFGGDQTVKTVDRRNQTAHLNFKPDVHVFINNGIAYARLKTDGISGIELRSDNRPSSQFETDSTYYLASANMTIWANAGQVDFWWPSNENTQTGAGSNTDQTTGINASIGEFGGDFSSTAGQTLDRQVNDYQIRGYSDRGGASYDWVGCGLATTQVVTDNCLYRSATDMFDEDTFSLLTIKPIATSMTLMQTDSVFRLGPIQNLPDKINLLIYVTAKLDAVAIRPANRSTGDQLLHDMERSFSIFWTTEAWERMFESGELKGSRQSLEAVAAQDTAGFRIIFELDISQLK